jgi:hypothetical protein
MDTNRALEMLVQLKTLEALNGLNGAPKQDLIDAPRDEQAQEPFHWLR